MNFLSNIFFFVFFLLLLLSLCSVACFHMFASLIRFPASLYFPFLFLMLLIPSFIPHQLSLSFYPPSQQQKLTLNLSISPTKPPFLFPFHVKKKEKTSKKGNLSVLYHKSVCFLFAFIMYNIALSS